MSEAQSGIASLERVTQPVLKAVTTEHVTNDTEKEFNVPEINASGIVNPLVVVSGGSLPVEEEAYRAPKLLSIQNIPEQHERKSWPRVVSAKFASLRDSIPQVVHQMQREWYCHRYSIAATITFVFLLIVITSACTLGSQISTRKNS